MVKVASVAALLCVITGVGVSLQAMSPTDTHSSRKNGAYIATSLDEEISISSLSSHQGVTVAAHNGKMFVFASCSDVLKVAGELISNPCDGSTLRPAAKQQLLQLGIPVIIGEVPAKSHKVVMVGTRQLTDVSVLELLGAQVPVFVERLDGSETSSSVLGLPGDSRTRLLDLSGGHAGLLVAV